MRLLTLLSFVVTLSAASEESAGKRRPLLLEEFTARSNGGEQTTLLGKLKAQQQQKAAERAAANTRLVEGEKIPLLSKLKLQKQMREFEAAEQRASGAIGSATTITFDQPLDLEADADSSDEDSEEWLMMVARAVKSASDEEMATVPTGSDLRRIAHVLLERAEEISEQLAASSGIAFRRENSEGGDRIYNAWLHTDVI